MESGMAAAPRSLNSVAKIALRRVPSMLRQDSRVQLRRHSLVVSPRPDPSPKSDMPVPCCVPRILVHGASTENEESMDSGQSSSTRHTLMESSLGTNSGHTLTREESVDSDLGRQGLAREDTIESLLSSPDLDSYC